MNAADFNQNDHFKVWCLIPPGVVDKDETEKILPSLIHFLGNRPAGTPEYVGVAAKTAEDAVAYYRHENPEWAHLEWDVRLYFSAAREDVTEEDIIVTQVAPRRGPAVSANMLYSLDREDSYDLYDCGLDDFFCDVRMYDLPNHAHETQKRVSTRGVVTYWQDSDRSHSIVTVWFDGKPIGVLQTGGRGASDHLEYWVTDIEGYRNAETFLRSLVEEDEEYAPIVQDPDEKLQDFTSFYGMHLIIPEFGEVNND